MLYILAQNITII